MTQNGRHPTPAEPSNRSAEPARPGNIEPHVETGANLGVYLATLRRHRLLVALMIILAAAFGFAASSVGPRSYEATASVLLGQKGSVDALLGRAAPSADPERDLNTSVQLVALDSIANRVRRRLALRESADTLLSSVKTAVEGNSDIVSIRARASGPGLAARIANAFAVEYRDFRTESARAGVAAALTEAQRRLKALGPDAGATSFGRRLAAEVNRLQILSAFETGGVQIVRRATPPTTPSGMSALKTATLAALLGMILAGGVIVVLARTDHRLHDENDVERAGLAVLASVPAERRNAPFIGRLLDRSDDDASREAYATLAGWLGYSNLGKVPRTVLLTSLGDGGAAPSVALGLARALRTIARRVVAIEADLRTPRWSGELNLRFDRGLADLLLGHEALNSAVFDLPEDAGRVATHAAVNDGYAWLLPVGRRVTEPQALLAGNRMAGLVQEAWHGADFVLIAAPAIARAGEVLALAALCDGAVIIVERGRVTEEAARRAVRSLEDIDVPVLGAVVTRVSRRWSVPRVGRQARRPRRRGLSKELVTRDGFTRPEEDREDGASRNARVLAMLQSGTSQAEIARELGIARTRVGRIAKDLREQGLLAAGGRRKRAGGPGGNGRTPRGGVRP